MKLGPNAIGIQQSAAIGAALTGILNPNAPTWVQPRSVYVEPPAVGGVGGLFRPQVASEYANPFCTTMFMSCGAGVTWEVFITSGLTDGVPTTTVDAPVNDVPLASGTGPELVLINRELLRSQLIRVVCSAAAGKDTIIIINFAAVMNSGGRLVA
jgi:hypothetical protein